jgi:hypothetical protein
VDRQKGYCVSHSYHYDLAVMLAELRGFEPLTSAVQTPVRFTAPPLPILQGLLSKGVPLDPALDRRYFKSPVEVRASVHRRSSPRPSSFQIQVKS